jgi:hypothetical protein
MSWCLQIYSGVLRSVTAGRLICTDEVSQEPPIFHFAIAIGALSMAGLS